MNNQFHELTKELAQSVTRRAALKRFGVGLAGMALACFGLANSATAGPKQCGCQSDADCGGGSCVIDTANATSYCIPKWCTSACCCHKQPGRFCETGLPSCAPIYSTCASLCHANTLCLT